jgi:hypothetical protein
MSAVAQTRVFGIRLGVDPKILLTALITLAAFLFWYESGNGDDSLESASSVIARVQTHPSLSSPSRLRALEPRRTSPAIERNTPKLRPIDATRGDIDPTLRLDLLDRLQGMPEPGKIRNLFEMAPSAPTEPLPEIHGPVIMTTSVPVVMPAIAPVSAPEPTPIPLKYCGFVKPLESGKSKKGFFLDGDIVLIGSEGEILRQRYMVMALTGTSARLEDIQLKQDQTLSVPTEAKP